MPGEQFVSCYAVGEDVHAVVEGQPLQLFGCHVYRSPGVILGFLRTFGDRLGEVEVYQTHARVAAEHHVLGLKIEMHEPSVMDMLQRQSHIDQDGGDVFIDKWSPLRRPKLEVLPLQILH